MAWLKVKPSKLEGKIEAQPSKSYTHRALSIGLLAEGTSKVVDPLWSLDTRATLDVVQGLGAKARRGKNLCEIFGSGGKLKPRRTQMDVRNSGTTIRFMSAIASLSPKPIRLVGDRSILARPMGPLIESLSELGAGAKCEGSGGRPPVVVGGGIEGGRTRITGGISSQFISALLLASPYSRSEVEILVEEGPKSKPYIQMTLEVLELAGARVKSDSSLTEFEVPGDQRLGAIDFEVPGDYSSAAFVLGGAILTGSEVEVSNLDPEDVQGDRLILEFLEEFGADVKVRGKIVQVAGEGELEGIEADCSDTPDLVPILGVLGAAAKGWTRLTGISHLRFKEVDRLKALRAELRRMGARVKETEDGLKIHGTRQLRGGSFRSYGDHRTAMALAMGGLAARGTTFIDGAESIDVSYPKFVEDMQALGARVEVHKH